MPAWSLERHIRRRWPRSAPPLPRLPLLVPGVGAQGGDLAGSVQAGANAAGGGVLMSVSRGVMSAADPGAAAAEFQAAMRAAAEAPPVAPASDLDGLLIALFDAGIIKFERITLKSGRVSPYYHNMRALVAQPALLRRVAAAYAARLRELALGPGDPDRHRLRRHSARGGAGPGNGPARGLCARERQRLTVRARWWKGPGRPGCAPC